MKHRVFIAINLPEEIKKELLNIQKKLVNYPMRWTEELNLHITLIFIGYVFDEQILKISKITKEVVLRYKPFLINLNRVYLGPSNRTPRMVWVGGERNTDLIKLKNDLEDALFASKNSGYHQKDNREFNIHITLGRIKQRERGRLPLEPIDQKISLAFPVNSIEIMESKLRPTGPEYFVLEILKLGK